MLSRAISEGFNIAADGLVVARRFDGTASRRPSRMCRGWWFNQCGNQDRRLHIGSCASSPRRDLDMLSRAISEGFNIAADGLVVARPLDGAASRRPSRMCRAWSFDQCGNQDRRGHIGSSASLAGRDHVDSKRPSVRESRARLHIDSGSSTESLGDLTSKLARAASRLRCPRFRRLGGDAQ
jgi:hypothetical protein